MPADSNETPAFNLDELKFLPAWMKEEPAAPPKYRDYRNDETASRRPFEGDRRAGAPRGDRDRRGGPGRVARPGGGGGDRVPSRVQGRPEGSGAPRRDRSEGDRRGGPRGSGGGRNRFDERDARPSAPPQAPVQTAPVRVDFVPDPRGLASIAKQIRASHLAYPLFGMARMFLSRPERHRVRLSAEAPARMPANGNGVKDAPPALTLFQLGEDGPVALDKAVLEKIAFDRYCDTFYTAETIQKDPPKGNFTNVARERLSGTLLGPTNHHAYQTNLRALYDNRFSRRMSFEQYRRGIEVVSDPALVERWKEETRTTTVFTLRPPGSQTAAAASDETPLPPSEENHAAATLPDDASVPGESPAAPSPDVALETETATTSEPASEAPAPSAPPRLVLQSLAEARQHFREHYFDAMVRSGAAFELPGEVARTLPEPGIMQAIRQAHDREIKYPGGLVQPLRAGLQNTGLHVFKHRKRVVYVSIARPTPFQGGDSAVSESVSAILEAVTQHPLCTRKQLAEHVLARRFGSTATDAFRESGAAAETSTTTPPAELPAATQAAVEPNTNEAATAPASSAANADAAPAPASEAATEAHVPESVTPPVAPQDAALAKAKAGLAADLRYLVQAGHIIEFHNGTFDLPLLPKPKEPPVATAQPTPAASTKLDPTAAVPAAAGPPPTENFPSPTGEPEVPAPAPALPATESEVFEIANDPLQAEPDAAPEKADAPPADAASEEEPSLPVWEEPAMDPEAETTATTSMTSHSEPAAETPAQPEENKDRPPVSP